MVFNTPPKRKNKNAERSFSRYPEKLREQWPYGRNSKAQWIQAFEEEAKRTNHP
jgi:hypothetical protein